MLADTPILEEIRPIPTHNYMCEDKPCDLPAAVEITYTDEDNEVYSGFHCTPHANKRESELAADGAAYRLELVQ